MATQSSKCIFTQKCARVLRILCFAAFSSVIGLVTAQTNILTHQVDNARTSWNSKESWLTPYSVGQQSFGLLYRRPVDGPVYAEPLSVANVNIPGKGVHNVVYVVTDNDSVYAFDADHNTGADAQPLWHVTLGAPATIINGNAGEEIGIRGTPVIRLTGTGTGYIYLIAKTQELVNGMTGWVQRLHALDITTGQEAFGGPVEIHGVVNGTGDGNDGKGHIIFNWRIQQQHSALLFMQNGTTPEIIIAWASYGDFGPYHGWVMAYNADTLKQIAVFNTTANALTDPSGYPIAGGGVWQSGGGPASDGTNIYFATGNGLFNPLIDSYGDSILKMSPTLQLLDYFTPMNQLALDKSDGDLGSGGVLLLPPSAGSSATPNVLVQAGKEGTLRLLNRDSLGLYNSNSDMILSELPEVMGGIWSNPAYFNSKIYYGPVGWPIVAFGVGNASIQGGGYIDSSNNSFGYPGATPSISSNGDKDAIVWAVDSSGYITGAPDQLYAYDATNLSNVLYSSLATAGRDVMGPAVKFVVPLVQGGFVYVGANKELDVFGLGRWTPNPSIQTPSGTYQGAMQVTVMDPAGNAALYYTTDGSMPTQRSTRYYGPVTLNQSATFTVIAIAPGYGASAPATANYLVSPVYGHGDGLYGSYYNGKETPSGEPTTSEVDQSIDFDWNGDSPAPGVSGSDWSAQWTGAISPLCSSIYKFYSYSSGGVQVWINGLEVINTWSEPTVKTSQSGSLSLVAGQKYSLRILFEQGTGNSFLQFYWSALGMPTEAVPQSQLYSSYTALRAIYPEATSVAGGNSLTGSVIGFGDEGHPAISLSSSNPAAATVPTSLDAADGPFDSYYAITTHGVNATVSVKITATYAGVSKSTTLSITPSTLSKVALTLYAVPGGESVVGAVYLNGQAGPAGMLIQLGSSSTSAAVPASVTIPAGKSFGSFRIITSKVSTPTTAEISATSQGAKVSVKLTVNP